MYFQFIIDHYDVCSSNVMLIVNFSKTIIVNQGFWFELLGVLKFPLVARYGQRSFCNLMQLYRVASQQTDVRRDRPPCLTG